ncbi:MAG: hypothetical protein FWG98_06010 [Candidatus Cloacimonetes bacterium]|nr:hypothetical protein [Candidatus Cloacimonadota bacterium]
MILVNFKENHRNVFFNKNIFLTGSCFKGEKLLKDELFFQDLENVENKSQLEEKLNQYNGFFAFVICLNNSQECLVAVDRVRSIPLFYGSHKENCFISNDAEWVRQNVGDMNIDPISEQEFLMTGYVTGKDTLFRGVKQLQAGEFLHISNQNNKSQAATIEFQTFRYYKYLHSEPQKIKNKESYQQDLDLEVSKSIQRLINFANGRQIVIPLSAGRDSRLIALKIKQAGYKNVLCFSYGVKGNFEAETSKKIAELLNFNWVFTEYTEQLGYKWYNSIDRKNYYLMAFNYTSLPVMQDWAAIMDMKKRGLIDKDAVFTPGHTGDFISGGHIPIQAHLCKKANIKILVNEIKNRHYSLIYTNSNFIQFKDNNAHIKTKQQKQFWENRIITLCEINDIKDAYDFYNITEMWNWQERQAKFIVNSARDYEYWGYDWWFPFWDSDYMLFWQQIPLVFRKNKLLYNEYVDSLFKKITGIEDYQEINNFGLKNSRIKNFIFLFKIKSKFLIKKIAPQKHFIYFIRKYKLKSNTVKQILGEMGAFSDNFVAKNKKKLPTVNGLFAIFTIEELKTNLIKKIK